MKRELLSFLLLIFILTLPLGCVTHNPDPRVTQAYDGPELDAKQIAIVHNDVHAYIHIEGKYATESYTFKPGKQTILVGYLLSLGNATVTSKKHLPIETTLEAGHEYQVVCYGDGLSFFSAGLADVTTDEDVLKYLRTAPDGYQKQRAVKLLRSQSHLNDIALQHPDSSVREYAIPRLNSREVLRQVIENDIDSEVRKSAEKRLRKLAATQAP